MQPRPLEPPDESDSFEPPTAAKAVNAQTCGTLLQPVECSYRALLSLLKLCKILGP